MLSKGKIKKINSLKEKKSRQISQLFTIEGIKSVKEIATSGSIFIKELYLTSETTTQIPEIEGVTAEIITADELKKISTQSSPEGVLAVCSIPQHPDINWQKDHLYIALDDVRDPGNLGTIIRLADWFGVQDIICTHSTVDLYNPKTVQSTMGSISHVRVHYTDLKETLSKCPLPIYGTFLHGENIYATQLSTSSVIVIGNEANGISPEIEALVTQKITIPQFGDGQKAESLNAAMATAATLAIIRGK